MIDRDRGQHIFRIHLIPLINHITLIQMMTIVKEIIISKGETHNQENSRQNARNKSSCYENTGYDKSNPREAEAKCHYNSYRPGRNPKNNITFHVELEQLVESKKYTTTHSVNVDPKFPKDRNNMRSYVALKLTNR